MFLLRLEEVARFEHFHALLSRPQTIFAGKSREELAAYKEELDRLL